MLLEGKNAIIYGAGGSVGGAVARTFAREGARVFLTGRTPAPLDAVATAIRRARGTVDTATVNALDEVAVARHADAVVEAAGSLDISFNAIAVDHVQVALADLPVEQIVEPVAGRVATHVITALSSACARWARPNPTASRTRGKRTSARRDIDRRRGRHPRAGHSAGSRSDAGRGWQRRRDHGLGPCQPPHRRRGQRRVRGDRRLARPCLRVTARTRHRPHGPASNRPWTTTARPLSVDGVRTR
jgi:NAD(P)-dependent dehydrogenase (short-subunit alcohol dehydrogenase family)